MEALDHVSSSELGSQPNRPPILGHSGIWEMNHITEFHPSHCLFLALILKKKNKKSLKEKDKQRNFMSCIMCTVTTVALQVKPSLTTPVSQYCGAHLSHRCCALGSVYCPRFWEGKRRWPKSKAHPLLWERQMGSEAHPLSWERQMGSGFLF